jgi:hypothetical protein
VKLVLVNEMNTQTAAGIAFAASTPIINTAASAIGVAKTGVAIGTLHGAAHTSARGQSMIGAGFCLKRAITNFCKVVPLILVGLDLDHITQK